MSSNPEAYVRLSIPSDADYIDLVRLTLYGIATKQGFSFEEIEDMKVAVAEACNNVVLHAYQSPQMGSIDIEFKWDSQSLCIHVKDYGKSFNYEKEYTESTSLHEKEVHELKVGGLGLYMMQALMDEVRVMNNEGTEVVLTKFLKRTEGEFLA
ncbi:anti-sigma B factor RsbW [Ammoniphilus sp. CFH 90114]|uniref:anti-sigma B factor RsbW n=1 Tax=Ammoniphilus sp. CFH 90114 TaxID=2493665 RepID=UPI00100FDF96|nr:anti-sigma B factor RsbW [Ammoniphilus sp. CFH 90114]RXT15453.1 anti-sigma B factor RsbW [Ammoniphilus sp. CFH 90114]